MSKYKIKMKYDSDGTPKYYVSKRFLFFFYVDVGLACDYPAYFDTMEKAEAYIETYELEHRKGESVRDVW